MSKPTKEKSKSTKKEKTIPIKIPKKEKETWCFGCLQQLGNQEAHMGPGGCLEEK